MPAITVPRLGWSMEQGTFVRWLKAHGDHVKIGEPLFELESDKSTEAVEAIDSGVLYVPDDGPKPGETVKVGQVVGLLLDERTQAPPSVGHVCNVPLQPREDGAPSGEQGRHVTNVPHEKRKAHASPRARRAARELGIDLTSMRGSGRDGRIRERDVRLAPVGVEAEGRLVPRTGIRQVIAARMVAGVTQAAPVTLTTRADVTDLVPLRASGSYIAFLMKAVAVALREHPALRSQWRDEGLFVPERIHLAFAVDTPAGLFAPVVRDVDRLCVAEIGNLCRTLAGQARAGTLPAEAMRGAVFTVSNLGAYGVEAFTPIIHLPQCAILGVGRIVREPAFVEDRVVPRDRMTLSLTFDHRVTDGAPAARFLDAVRGLLEHPESLDVRDEREGL